MSRLFWLALGATVGIMVVRKATRAAAQLTPGGVMGNLAEGIRELGSAVREFSEEVRAGMSQRESELRAGVGLDGKLGATAEDFDR